MKEQQGVKGRYRNGKKSDIKQVLRVDDTVMVAETRDHLQYIENEFERKCDKMLLKLSFTENDQRGKL